MNVLRPSFLPALVLLTLTGACGGAEEAASPPTGEGATAETAEIEPRIPMAPTPGDVLPPALLGEAPPLGGMPVNYDPSNPASIGYLALPEGEGPFPSVILIHEWNGLVDRVREVADALAAEGYVALAADLFSGQTGSNPQENMALVSAAREDPAAMIGNLDAAVAFLRERPDVTGRVGAMGWCFGGGVALSFGLDGEHHEATAIFYGQLLDDPEALAHLPHEVYGTFAREDQGPSPEQVEAFRQALDAAGVEHDLHIYDEVNHGFWLHVDQDPEVRSAPALDAWERLKAYLARALS
ncbi:MAG: dienelactone hydrolase family protein [Gemmatimonadales bacterium]|nr:MAG: dienelactone hydrolase family protein [Gemmatimonadales bacterium]